MKLTLATFQQNALSELRICSGSIIRKMQSLNDIEDMTQEELRL